MKSILFALVIGLSVVGAARAQLQNVYSVTEKWKVVVNGVTNSGSATGIISVRLGSFTLMDKIGFPHLGGALHGYIYPDGTLDSHPLVYGIAPNFLGEAALVDLNFTTIAVNLGSEAGTTISPNYFNSSNSMSVGQNRFKWVSLSMTSNDVLPIPASDRTKS